jgi:hypothetical protein
MWPRPVWSPFVTWTNADARLVWVTRGKAQSEYLCSVLPQLADIARSAFNQITRPGSEQFHARLWLNNATRLSGMEWLWSAKRA